MKVIKHKDKWYLQSETGYKEILLSTDTELQKDGVQAIDDTFLEWFVKNPSCEYVEINRDWGYSKIIISKEEPKYTTSNLDNEKYKDFSVSQEKPKDVVLGYKTSLDAQMLDKIEPKQETLEEVDENKKNLYYYKQVMNPYPVEEYSYTAYEKGFIEGYQESTKWQAERMYSEEEVLVLIHKRMLYTLGSNYKESTTVEWFNQLKKPAQVGWIATADKLPKPLQTVWLTNGKGWCCLGCLVEDFGGCSHWAESNGVVYIENGEIVSECESDDLDVVYWHELPKLIF